MFLAEQCSTQERVDQKLMSCSANNADSWSISSSRNYSELSGVLSLVT